MGPASRVESRPEAAPDADLTCKFFMRPGALTVSLGVPVDGPVDLKYDSFAWQVLATLATDASADTSGGQFTVSVTMEPGAAGVGD